MERLLDPDRWAVRSREMPDDGGAALQRERSPDWEARLMRTCSGPFRAVQAPMVSASTLLTPFGQLLGSGFPIDPKIAHSLRLLPAGALNAGDTEGREGNGWGCGTLALVRMDSN
jgi:hypothetical protein